LCCIALLPNRHITLQIHGPTQEIQTGGAAARGGVALSCWTAPIMVAVAAGLLVL
jgi:hypothetical protein